MAELMTYFQRMNEDNIRIKSELMQANAEKNEAEELADASMDSLEKMGVDLDEE